MLAEQTAIDQWRQIVARSAASSKLCWIRLVGDISAALGGSFFDEYFRKIEVQRYSEVIEVLLKAC
jgi:hypothetical protein